MTIAQRPSGVLHPSNVESPQHRASGFLHPLPAVDALLLSMFRTLAGARGLLVRDGPEGSTVYLIVDDRDVEDRAYEMFARALGLYGPNPPTFVAVPVAEADAVIVSEDSRAYPLP